MLWKYLLHLVYIVLVYFGWKYDWILVKVIFFSSVISTSLSMLVLVGTYYHLMSNRRIAEVRQLLKPFIFSKSGMFLICHLVYLGILLEFNASVFFIDTVIFNLVFYIYILIQRYKIDGSVSWI